MQKQAIKNIDIQHVTYGFNSNQITTVNPYDTRTLLFENTIPGESSKIIGVQLASINPKVLSNIKFGIIDIGTISWSEGLFTYDVLDFYDEKASAKNIFYGINSNSSAGSMMNIGVKNINSKKSQIVHLRLNLPKSVNFQQTCMVFKWFFEYG